MRRLWVAFVMVSVIGSRILGWVGSRIYQEAPPIPERVLTADGSVVVPDGDIGRGQNVWQTMSGMEVGSVWGHGSYVAPDWTADWLHREAVFILNDWARAEAGRSYLELEPEGQAALRERLTRMMRRNGYDPRHACADHRAGARPGVRGQSPTLREHLRERPCPLRHPSRHGQRSRSAAPSVGLLLLDGVGGGDEPPYDRHHLHEQLASRAAHRQPPDRRGGRVDRRERA